VPTVRLQYVMDRFAEGKRGARAACVTRSACHGGVRPMGLVPYEIGRPYTRMPTLMESAWAGRARRAAVRAALQVRRDGSQLDLLRTRSWSHNRAVGPARGGLGDGPHRCGGGVRGEGAVVGTNSIGGALAAEAPRWSWGWSISRDGLTAVSC